jgi:hypothetical protein
MCRHVGLGIEVWEFRFVYYSKPVAPRERFQLVALASGIEGNIFGLDSAW